MSFLLFVLPFTPPKKVGEKKVFFFSCCYEEERGEGEWTWLDRIVRHIPESWLWLLSTMRAAVDEEETIALLLPDADEDDDDSAEDKVCCCRCCCNCCCCCCWCTGRGGNAGGSAPGDEAELLLLLRRISRALPIFLWFCSESFSIVLHTNKLTLDTHNNTRRRRGETNMNWNCNRLMAEDVVCTRSVWLRCTLQT